MRTLARAQPVVAALLLSGLATLALLVARHYSAPHYGLSAREAIAAARSDPEDRRYLARNQYTSVRAIELDRGLRRVAFFDGPRSILDAAVDSRGRVRFREEHRPGTPELGSRIANAPAMLALLTGLFLLATLVVPLRRLRNLDALAFASFVVPVVLLNDRLVVASAVTGSLALAYLAGRSFVVGFGSSRAGSSSTPLFVWLTRNWTAQRSLRMLALVTGAALLAFLAITLTSSGEGDVAAASLSGATDLLHARPPYGHIVQGVVHGDTYPFLNYVAYMPGAAWKPVTDAFSDLSGALVVTAAAALGAAVCLYRLGVRHGVSASPNPAIRLEGKREAGVRAVLAWLTFPPVLLTASSGANDMVLAACLAWMVLLAVAAGRSSLLLAAASWVKVVPLVLLPMWLLRLRGRDLRRGVVAVLLLSLALVAWLLLLGRGGVGQMVHDVAFQFERESFHAVWLPLHLGGLQIALQALLVGSVAYVAMRLRTDVALRQDGVAVAALAGGLLLAVQVVANYWTPAYLPWAYAVAAFALLGRAPSARPRAPSAATAGDSTSSISLGSPQTLEPTA